MTLDEIKAYSALAEVKALTADTAGPLERRAIQILQGHLGRQLTLASEAKRLQGSDMTILGLPDRLESFSSVITAGGSDVTAELETTNNGWMLRFIDDMDGIWHHESGKFRSGTTYVVTGVWGMTADATIKDAICEVIEALAVRRGDAVSRRNEVSAFGSISDGDLRADRTSRRDTAEELLRDDLRLALRSYRRPNIIGAA